MSRETHEDSIHNCFKIRMNVEWKPVPEGSQLLEQAREPTRTGYAKKMRTATASTSMHVQVLPCIYRKGTLELYMVIAERARA
jgi:hypothetical protein